MFSSRPQQDERELFLRCAQLYPQLISLEDAQLPLDVLKDLFPEFTNFGIRGPFIQNMMDEIQSVFDSHDTSTRANSSPLSKLCSDYENKVTLSLASAIIEEARPFAEPALTQILKRRWTSKKSGVSNFVFRRTMDAAPNLHQTLSGIALAVNAKDNPFISAPSPEALKVIDTVLSLYETFSKTVKKQHTSLELAVLS